MFGAETLADLDLAGARNVFIAIGKGRLHFYDQPPHDEGRGAIHHLGIQTDDLEALVADMKAKGFLFRKAVSDFGFWKYVMVQAPENVLIELFQIVKEKAAGRRLEEAGTNVSDLNRKKGVRKT